MARSRITFHNAKMLQPKHQAFLVEYLVDANGARAAQSAGYTARSAAVTAHRLLRRPDVRAALAARQAQDSQRLALSRQEALRGLLEAIGLAREQGDPAAMIGGWREVGRMLGFYEPDRHAVDVSADVRVEQGAFERMSDAELGEVIRGGALG